MKNTKAELKDFTAGPWCHIFLLHYLSPPIPGIHQLVMNCWDCRLIEILRSAFELYKIYVTANKEIPLDGCFLNGGCSQRVTFGLVVATLGHSEDEKSQMHIWIELSQC